MNISSIPPSGLVSTQLPQTDDQQLGSKSSKAQQIPSATKLVETQDKRQQALQVVNKTLTMAYEKISSRGQSASAEYDQFEPLTAEKVASNILGFIERRLQMDVADGASQEALQARLEAGLSGFKQGFADASEKLKALSLLNPVIEADLATTYDKVTKGVEDLRSKFITALTPNPEATQAAPQAVKTYKSSDAPAASASTQTLDIPDFGARKTAASYANYEYGRAREFSFELTTKEGDKVRINVASSEGFAFESGQVQQGNRSGSAANGSYSSSQSMSFQVEGELNDDELEAINKLLGQVNNLAEQFFAGNLDNAFQQAASLGYDDAQIGGFSLNLAQSEIQVTQAYQAYEPAAAGQKGLFGGSQSIMARQLEPLGHFIKDLLDSLDTAQPFAEPQSVVTDIAQQMPASDAADQDQGQRLVQFMSNIFALKLS